MTFVVLFTYRISSFSRASLSCRRSFFTFMGLLGTNQAATNLQTTTTCCKKNTGRLNWLHWFRWTTLPHPHLEYKPRTGWQRQNALPRLTRTEKSVCSPHHFCSLCSCTHETVCPVNHICDFLLCMFDHGRVRVRSFYLHCVTLKPISVLIWVSTKSFRTAMWLTKAVDRVSLM